MKHGWRAAGHLEVRAELDSLGRVRDFVDVIVASCGMRGECSGQLLLAVDEAVSNIVMHGSPGGEAHIELDVLEDLCAVAVRIRDDASPFDPTAVSVPELDTSPMEREQPGGFGVELMRRLVDELRYGVTDDGRNELILVKKRPE